MKTSLIFRPLLLAIALAGVAAHAADPQPQAAPSAADIQALMALLNKIAAQSAATEPAAAEEPVPAPLPAAPAPAPAAPAAKQPLSTALKTGGLSTGGLSSGGLTTSAPLGGRGSVAGVRQTEETWRLLFPAKQPGN